MVDITERMAELKGQMDEAFEKGDLKAVGQAAKAMKALDDEAHKEERDAIAKEREGVIAKVEKDLRKLVEKHREAIERVGINKIQWRALEPNGDGWLVGPKTRKGKGGGGGGAGETKKVFGKSLGELFEEHATPEERAAFDEAQAIPDLSKRGNKTYQVKVAVKKRLIAEGTLVPQS